MASPSGSNPGHHGTVVSVNIGDVTEVESNGRNVRTGIFKVPTTEPQRVADIHIGTDQQADTVAHGGRHKAVYAYAAEDYGWWEGQLNRQLDVGLFGENLLTEGLDLSNARVGDRWSVGTAVLEVSEPRMPCFKLTLAVGEPRFQKTFANADRPGAYFRIVVDGELTVGDTIDVAPTTEPSITLAEISAIYHRERERAGELLDVASLSEAWHEWARTALSSRQ